ncbi:MAG: DUF488 domain-containing protein [Candidatus Eremiobacteraeota bacterium]|nr:DUF488 domain-containing protein [Candidatus Eremiobacteraeota bacterium]MBV8364945.1 DUF488 domain-containing protein [Candidatus Eremiobacteraeota bacterium]
MTLYTIGHGTRSQDELFQALRTAGVTSLVDVRAYPRSRTNPQFNKEALAVAGPAAGFAYEHWPVLGGRRRGLGDASPNTIWRHPSFRAYADYMLTEEFWEALSALLARAQAARTAVMCSETLWWRCHRRLIADAAMARGVPVLHIMKSGVFAEHVVSAGARFVGDRVVYSAER